MRTFETNDLVNLNSIIYRIHTVENIQEMRRQILPLLSLLIEFDSADFYLANRGHENGLIEPVFYNCKVDLSAEYDNQDYSRGVMYSGRSLTYKESDIISEESRVKSLYYNKVYRPNNWHYSLQCILAENNEFVGVVTLYRTLGKPDFEYDDIFVMDMIKEHLSYRLYKYKKDEDNVVDKYTVSQASAVFGLTQREQIVLRALLDGFNNTEICEHLSITENTLKKHILNIYRKLGIRNRVQMFKMIREKSEDDT